MIINLLEQIFFRLQNTLEVLSSEIPNFTINMLIGGGVWFLAFYFLSRFFRAYVIRLALLLLGLFLLWNVTARNHMLDNIDLFIALGLIIPQVEIVELTYLILKEKILRIYYKTLAFLQFISRPFVWLYARFKYLNEYFKAKQEEKQQQEQFGREFKERQKQEYEKEQARYDEFDRREQQRHSQQKQQRKQEYSYRQKQEAPKQEEKKSYSRWDSSDPYEVLDIPRTASRDEIKKKYRQLCKLYHPDKTQDPDKKIKNEKIFQKINGAYEKLE